VRLCGSQDKYDVRRRFLQGLQQGITSRIGKHVDLVHDIYLIPGKAGGIVDLFPEIADVINPAIAGGVHLHHIQRHPCGD
jgi:hypothetical protein